MLFSLKSLALSDEVLHRMHRKEQTQKLMLLPPWCLAEPIVPTRVQQHKRDAHWSMLRRRDFCETHYPAACFLTQETMFRRMPEFMKPCDLEKDVKASRMA
jgi:hypothetical protein